MTGDLPAPLVPADCDLRDFKFMPLEVARLRRSKAWLIAKRKPELGFYMMNLWAASWHAVPAGSIEDDDDVLCDLAMCTPRRWEAVREQVMRGWVKCSDGRLYHDVVAEKANESWEKKCAQRDRTKNATKARRDRNEQRNDDVTFTKGQGQGQGERQGEKEEPLAKANGHGVPELLPLEAKPPVPKKPPADDLRKRCYDRGKEIFGPSSGGLVTNILKAKDNKPAKALALIEDAAEKREPLEYINGWLWNHGPPDIDVGRLDST